jgi:transposase
VIGKDNIIRQLQEEVALLKEKITELELNNTIIREENKELKEENQKLRLALYGIKPPKKKKGSEGSEESAGSEGKKRGPPKGHKGTSRKRPDRVDRTVILQLDACPDCGGELSELEPRERYVEDIIPAALFVTKYVIKQGYCKSCDKIVYPEVPEVIDNCHFGIHFLLYITYLRFVLNLPYNKMVALLNDTYGANVSEGTLVNYIKKAAEIFGAEYRRIKREMKKLNCHYDDTGQRIAGENKWLWVFIAKEAVFYHTNKSRSKKVVIKILGEDYDGVTVQDFYPSYDGAPGVKQKCWAHLLREVRGLTEKKSPPPGAKEFYKALKAIYDSAKESVKHLTTAEERERHHRLYVEKLENLAKQDYEHHDIKRLAKRCLKYSHELFTFILVPDIESTNNVAERALRPCVVQRKIWGCHRTMEGAKHRDTIMSVMGTMKLQGKNLFTDGREYVLNASA